jgi:hypothetical protein
VGKETEAYLHYLWSKKLFRTNVFRCTEDHPIEILNWGIHNTKENGPDFKFACIQYKGLKWFGHIELHLKSSEWFVHKHHHDPQYENVILHVVREHDIAHQVFSFPTVVITDDGILPYYLNSKGESTKSIILCGRQVTNYLVKEKFDLNKLLYQRIQRKSLRIHSVDLTYESIASFGKNTNSALFRFIADNWPNSGQNIWEFTKRYHQELRQLQVTKRSYANARLSAIYQALESFVRVFSFEDFSGSSTQNVIGIITKFIDSLWFKQYHSIGNYLIINCWIPFFWKFKLIDAIQARQILCSLTSEKNYILTEWKNIGIIANNAAESQAILEIYSQLCMNKKCLSCQIGKELLS